MRKIKLLVAVALALTVSDVAGAQRRIGNWNGSGRSWNDADMSTTKTTMTSRGHTVFADAAITAANLLNYDVFIIGQGTQNITGAEAATLGAWVSGGGRLVTLWDSGNSGNPFNNSIMTALGLALQGGPGAAGGSTAFVGGNFATAGGPFNIVGQSLSTSPGSAISGGSALASDWLRFQGLGSGFAFAFADRSDHNIFAPSAANDNGKLLINIVESSTSVVPEPSTYLLVASGLAGLLLVARRRNRTGN